VSSVHEVYLIGGADDEKATFVKDEVGERCVLACTYRGKTISAEASDFFEALCAIRRQLEADGLIPFCYGASLNVFPSGMARNMGAGLKAYRLKQGIHARPADLVGIFDEGPDVVPSHVGPQTQFYKDWIASLRA